MFTMFLSLYYFFIPTMGIPKSLSKLNKELGICAECRQSSKAHTLTSMPPKNICSTFFKSP